MNVFKSYGHFIGLALLILALLFLSLRPFGPVRGWILYVVFLPLCLVAFGLYVGLNIDELRRGVRRRAFLYSSNLVFVILLALVILVLANIVLGRFHARFDFTEDKIHSLSPQTVRLLKSLKTDVKVRCYFLEKSDTRFRMEKILKLYADAGPRLVYEFIDPDKNPRRAQADQITGFNTSIFESGGKTDRITTIKEEDITNAIIKVTRSGEKVVYFLAGHGEKSLSDREETGASWARDNLEKLAYGVQTLEYALPGRIPEDCALLVVAGPEVDFSADEWTAVRDYIRRGGRALLLLDPGRMPGLVGRLAEFGVKVDDDFIYDELAAYVVGDERWPLTASFESHPVTEGLRYAAFFPNARTVGAAEEPPEGLTAAVLARSNKEPSSLMPGAWAERSPDQSPPVFDPETDEPGPVPMGVAVTVKGRSGKESREPDAGPPEGAPEEEETREGRLVVFGDSDFITNRFYYFNNNPANGLLFLNAVNWLSEETDLISIQPKAPSQHVLRLTPDRKRTISLVTRVFLPLFVLAAGLAVWIRRRSR
ncbi:MAG: GldG family protein [Candidatus Aminicenantes bacterium]|nr:GldG family protein [Candidatus Aminicenantes bacterium]